MKKLYVEPETTVVAINLRTNIMEPSNFSPKDAEPMEAGDTFNSREAISTPDAWEEW